jgi:hypothetical protein
MEHIRGGTFPSPSLHVGIAEEDPRMRVSNEVEITRLDKLWYTLLVFPAAISEKQFQILKFTT